MVETLAGAPIVVLARMTDRVSTVKLSDVLSIPRRRVRLATVQECVDVFGYQPGCFGPVAHRVPLQVIAR